MDLEKFALNDEVVRLESELAQVGQGDRLAILVPLAWHLRQRDTRRALRLCDDIEDLLAATDLLPEQKQKIGARIMLVRAEAEWLFARLTQAEPLVAQALEQFRAIGDRLGCADSHWLLAWIAVDKGRLDLSDAELQATEADALAANDPVRAGIAEAAVARWAVLHNLRAAEERWGARFRADPLILHPAYLAWRSDVLGMMAHYASDFGDAATQLMRLYDDALATGQIRTAIIAATNIAEGFDRLNDHAVALEWTHRSLDLARPTGWPRSIGACLMHMAETLRYAGRLDAAQEMLKEALDTLAPLSSSRTYAIALQYLGDLALDREDYDGALDAFRQLQERAETLRQTDFKIDSQRGQAHALSFLGQPEDALQCAHAALTLAEEQGDASRQIEALKVLADIRARHPTSTLDRNSPLHYLQLALQVAQTIAGYTVPSELYEALGREYAELGDFQHAYAMSLQTMAARERTHGREATNRAVAMQVMHQTARAKAEGEYLRELAAAEAKRAELLHQTGATLERLSVIGREVTAHLDTQTVFETLNRHVNGLLDVTSFAIYLCTDDGVALDLIFGMEEGVQLERHKLPVDDPDAVSARCVRERREILADWGGVAPLPNHMTDTLVTQSALFAPLSIGDRVMGVMTVQSLKRFAYAERDRLIFRTLCAYGAIALDNAEAYRRLQDAQEQLVSREKLAALGSLVAGVAHELNTPIGNSLMMTSTMLAKTDELSKHLKQGSIRRTELDNYLAQGHEASTLIMRSLNNAADLVQSFKQVAVDQTTAQRRGFDLQQVCHEIVATVKNQVKRSGHTVDLTVPEGIMMDSYPGPLGQVISNLINNALLHAFEDRKGGLIVLSAQPAGNARVRVRFQDNGVGIKEEHLKRIFDPFFTTKMGQGGSGLGLSISYNIVTSILGGQILVQSEEGKGSVFTLELPLTAPPRAKDSDFLG